MSGNKWVRGWFVVAMLALLLLPTTASALETMEQLTSKGRANIGFNTSLSYTSATNETVDGERARNATLFFLASPKFGFFFTDRLELTVQPGLLMRRLQRDEETRSTETSGLLDLGINFHLPINKYMAIVPGGGIGGYYGGSSRPTTFVDSDGNVQEVDASTTAFGLDAFGNLNLNYRVTDHTMLLAGVTFHYLFGTERSEDVDGLRVSTLNTSIGAGISYTF
jgi:hypothetical protein